MEKQLRFLILEDLPADAELMVDELNKSNFNFKSKCIGNKKEEFKSAGKLKDFILSNKGAIVFSDLAEADESVKILTIEGKEPGSEN